MTRRCHGGGSLLTPVVVLVAAAALLWPLAAGAAKKKDYVASGTCDGFPRLDLQTLPGTCVGLVSEDLKFPRGIAALPDGDLLVVDMGGWVPKRGSLWRFARGEGGFAATRLFDKLDEPHGVALGPDGLVYVGVLGGIFRFDPADPKGSRTDVIGGASDVAPLPGTGLHPLTSFVFDTAGALYVNVGSATNNCEGKDDARPDSAVPCPETLGASPRGVVRRYEMAWPEGRVLGWRDFASGLRNAVALVVHPGTNRVYAAENGRDAIDLLMPELGDDEELPHDEFVLLEEGRHYGWPYCYDDGLASPEYPDADCSAYEDPLLLLPAHVAPLGMTYYAAPLLESSIGGRLLVAYHGYRQYGHRLVAFPVGPQGQPEGDPIDVIAGWEAGPTRPTGAPVDVEVGADGAVYLTEDRNGTLLRLAPDRR